MWEGIKKSMKQSWKDFIERKGIKKWFQRDNLIIIVLSGILLLIISLPTKPNSFSKETTENKTSTGTSLKEIQKTTQKGEQQSFLQDSGVSQTSNLEASNFEIFQQDYAKYLEQRLQETLSGMEGVGKVKVMITLQSSQEQIVEKDRPISRSNTTESDAEGGSRTMYQTDSKEETIYYTIGNDSQPFVIKTLNPKVEGVVVVAQGAGTGEISRNITEAVQALFGIEAHKVKVVKAR